MWAVYAVEDGTLVSMHATEDECLRVAIEASRDHNAILAWAPALVMEQDQRPWHDDSGFSPGLPGMPRSAPIEGE